MVAINRLDFDTVLVYDEKPFHIFQNCDRFKCILLELIQYFQNSLILKTLSWYTASFCIFDSTGIESVFKNKKVFMSSTYI